MSFTQHIRRMHANEETTTEEREEEEPVATGDHSTEMHSVAKRPCTEEHLNKRSGLWQSTSFA